MDHIVKLALDFQAATCADDIELKEMNEYVQMYLLNMLGVNAGRYWTMNPHIKNSSMQLRRDNDGVVEILLHDFSNGFVHSARWDIDFRIPDGMPGPEHVRAARKNYLANGINSIIVKALQEKYKTQEFRVKVSIDKDKQTTYQW